MLDKYLNKDVKLIVTFPATFAKFKTGAEGKTLVNKKYVISINEI